MTSKIRHRLLKGLRRNDLFMYFNDLNVHKVGHSMTPRERLMTCSLGTTVESIRRYRQRRSGRMGRVKKKKMKMTKRENESEE